MREEAGESEWDRWAWAWGRGCLTYGGGLGAAEGQGSGPAGLGVEPPCLASWGQNSCLKSPVHGTLSGPTQQNQWSCVGGGSVWEGPSGRTG